MPSMHSLLRTLPAALALASLLMTSSVGCKKDPQSEAMLHFIIRTDSMQVRLDALGQPATIPAGNAAQSPRFHKISAHYIELTPSMYTQVGDGEILYHAAENTLGGSTAIDFDSARIVAPNDTFLSLPISSLAAGEYQYLRASILYQNYDIDFRLQAQNITGTGRLASLVGYNTYLRNLIVNQQSIAINDDKLQGFWAFEAFGQTFQGQSPAGATTVPNPLAATSPIPAGSCLVTGAFAQPLRITGEETEDITVIISLSTNQSFEWSDDGDGIYEPDVDQVVDMGLRGMIPSFE